MNSKETPASPAHVHDIVHTPEPWDRVVYDHGGSRIYVGVADGDDRKRELIADTYGEQGNADLIFASPKMLKALRRIEHFAAGDCDMPPEQRLELIAMECQATRELKPVTAKVV